MWPLAICNEMWKDEPIERVFEKAAKMGYDGVEIAPFTLAESAEQVSPSRRVAIARAAGEAGVQMPALHWLFVGPRGLHLTSPDPAVRKRSADYIKALADLCADLGGTTLVHGSPKQRSYEPPDTFEDAWKRAIEVVRACVPHLKERNVTWCFEALAPAETNFVNTAEKAALFADEIGEPEAVGIMLDTKAMSYMPGGFRENLMQYGSRARHLHVNDPQGYGPGMSDFDYTAVLQAAREGGYHGWISAEPFNYEPDPDTVARKVIETMKAARQRVLV